MDNGVIETGDPGNSVDLIAAAITVNANAVMLPDLPGDAEGTLQAALPVAEDLLKAHIKPTPILQGVTLKETEACARSFAKHLPSFKGFGVPRSFVENMDSRAKIVEYLLKRFPDQPVHLLGLSNNLADDLYVANNYENVMGLDSAIPIHMNELISQEGWVGKRPKRPHDYWKWTSLRTAYGQANVRRIKGWLRGANYVRTEREDLLALMETQKAE